MPRVDFSVYVISDRRQTGGRRIEDVLGEALRAGIMAVQIRERDLDARKVLVLAKQVIATARTVGAKVMINDRLDLVRVSGADGVHLRADSLSVAVARRLLGAGPLIGVSAHSVEEVSRAAADGADFAVLGPVFQTPSKRGFGEPIGVQTIEAAAARVRIPVFAIGGVTVERVPELLRAGASGVAVVSAVLAAANVASAARALLDASSARR